MEDVFVSALTDHRYYWSIKRQGRNIVCIDFFFPHFSLLVQTRDSFSVSFLRCGIFSCAMMLAILRWISIDQKRYDRLFSYFLHSACCTAR